MSIITINPSSITFNHKKGQSLPNFIAVQYTSYADYVSVHDLPDWLSVSDIIPGELRFSLNSNANDLSAGTHNVIVQIADNMNQEPMIRWTYLTVTLNLEDTIALSTNPANLSFGFTVGGLEPGSKLLSIISENNWTVSKNANWLNLSAAAGSLSGSINVSVVATGLAPGTYNDNITIEDGVESIIVPVSLAVSNPDTGSDFLHVFPTVLRFGFTKTGLIPPPKTIDITASGAFTVTETQSWISPSFTNGSSGSSTLTITMQDLSGLESGIHIGYVDLEIGDIVKRVLIELTVYEFVTEFLTPGQLYFSDDQNLIKVSSGRTDTHLSIGITANHESENYSLVYNVPFFKGVASKRIGSESRKIIGDPVIVSTNAIYALTPYNPVSLDLLINEVDLYSGEVLQSVNVSNVKMLKGKDPGSNLLSHFRGTVYMSSSGVLVFSVKSNGLALGTISLSGDINQDLNPTIPTAELYTVIINLNSLNGLVPGSEFEVSVLDVTIPVVIKEPQVDHSIVLFETEWGTMEAIEFLGEIKESVKTTQTKFQTQKNDSEKETRILESEQVRNFRIDTGLTMSSEEFDQLTEMLNSKHLWLDTGSGLIKVRNLTTNISKKSSLDDNKSYNLSFEEVVAK